MGRQQEWSNTENKYITYALKVVLKNIKMSPALLNHRNYTNSSPDPSNNEVL